MKKILILGATGIAGRHAAQAFTNAGWDVTPYDRKTDMIQAAQGMDLILNAMNPPGYYKWEKLLPPMTRQVIAAAKASGAGVILPGNLYNFGQQPGPWSATTKMQPVTIKGQIRVDIEKMYKNSGVKTLIYRSGNFIDPGAGGTLMRMVHMKSKGAVTAMGPSDLQTPYAFMPDWARGLVAIADQWDTLPAYCDIGFQGHSLSMQDLQQAVHKVTGQQPKLKSFPWFLIWMLQPLHRLSREIYEMRYLSQFAHKLDTKEFDRLVPGFTLTPVDQVIKTQLAS